MAIQIGAKPDSGFDDPLGMLTDCHRRIERFVQLLVTVGERAQGRALNPEEVAAVEAALQYFRIGGLRHNADEEESLFPRLRAAAGEHAAEIHALEHDHAEALRLHAEVEGYYAEWVQNGILAPEKTARLKTAAIELKQLYSAHIAIEENTVFPEAARLLNSDEISAIGREFRERRH